MTYNELHSELATHPKMQRLCRTLDIPVPTAIGHMALLWWWAMDYAPDGDLSDFDADDIADAAQYDGSSETFLDALLNCGPGRKAGFLERLDGRLMIHDWKAYGGKLHVQREENARRNREFRERKRGETSRNHHDETDDTSRDDHVRITRQTTQPSRDGLEERRGEENREEYISLAPDKPAQARDYHFEALAEACDVDLSNRTQRGRLNKAVADIKGMGGTPQQIPIAARNYPRVLPEGSMMTPTAIAAHWRNLIEYKQPESQSPYKPFDPSEPEPLYDE